MAVDEDALQEVEGREDLVALILAEESNPEPWPGGAGERPPLGPPSADAPFEPEEARHRPPPAPHYPLTIIYKYIANLAQSHLHLSFTTFLLPNTYH